MAAKLETLDFLTQNLDVVSRDEVDDILNAVEKGPLTVIVSNQPDEIVESVAGLALAIKSKPKVFKYKSIVAVPEMWLLDNPERTLAEAETQAQGGILFIPSLHEYLFGNTVVTRQLDQLVRKAFANGDFKIITSVAPDGWAKIKNRPPYTGIQNPILLLPPSTDKTVEIIKRKRQRIVNDGSTEGFTVDLPDEAIAEAVRLGSQYLSSKTQPTAAMEIIQRCITEQKLGQKAGRITTEDLRTTMKSFGFEVSVEDPSKYVHMEETLREKIIGQDEVVETVSRVIRAAKSGFKDPKRPIGSFMFLGPSGVGKTELAKQLATFLFNDENALIRFDMSEFSERHTLARFIGAPPGYVGFEDGGQLTEAVKQKPYSVVLFDEIEKADPGIFNIFLQILGDGRLTDGKGQLVDFRNTIIVFTSNIGSEYYAQYTPENREGVVNAVKTDVKASFRPEFLGRVKEIAVFNPLVPAALEKIVDLQISEINEGLKREKGIQIEVTPEVRAKILKEGYSPEYGARNLKNVLDKYISQSEKLNSGILSGEFHSGQIIAVTLENDEIKFAPK